MKVSGARRETTIMIGDNLQSDILGALNADIDAMLFNRWQISSEEIPQTLTFVVPTLSDIKSIL